MHPCGPERCRVDSYDQRDGRSRAFPDRRQQPRLPGVLRAAGIDRHLAGEPTNAIFGFASMLVKILTEYGPKATIVVWDAGMSGREQEYEPYKAERKPRPDLLREQWPHLEPLVEAFGYENVRVEGYEADDVIASLAEQAKQAGIPVMIVTGDRDAYQLADERQRADHDHLAGDHRHPRVRPRGRGRALRHPTRARAGLHRAEGRHVRQHPGRPGHRRQDRRPAAAEVRVARGACSSTSTRSPARSGARTCARTPTWRGSRGSLATLHRDIDAGVDVTEIAGRAARPLPPARGVHAASSCATPCGGWRRRSGEQEAAPRAAGERRVEAEAARDHAGGPRGAGDAAALAVARDGEALALGRSTTAASRCCRARPRRSRSCWTRGASGRSSPTTGRRSAATPVTARPPAGSVPALANDTMVAAYLIDPARRRYPLDELIEQAGIEAVVEGADGGPRRGGGGRGARAVRRPARRDRPARACAGCWRRSSCRWSRCSTGWSCQGVKLDTYRLGETAARVTEEIDELEHQICELAGEEFTIGSPQQLSRILFEKLELSRKRRGKTGFSTDARVLRAIRDEHAIVEKIETLARAVEAEEHLPRRAAGADLRARRAACTPPSTRRPPPPAACRAPTRTCRTSRSARSSGARSAAASSPSEGARLISADYSQVELRILAHVAGEDVLKDDLRARRGRAHGDRRRGAEARARRDRARASARARRPSTSGSSTASARTGSPSSSQIPHEEAAEYIERYLGRFPAVQAFIDRTIAEATERGLRADAVRPPPRRSPSCARASTRPARWASGWRSTRSSRAPRRTSSRSRWCAATRRCARRVLRRGWC